MADSLEDVVRETIEQALSKASVFQIARSTLAPRITFLITEHAQAGNFLGGGSQEDGEGYSTNTLPAFYFGDLKKTGDGWQLQSTELNRTVSPRNNSQNPEDGDLFWRTDPNGRPIPFLKGGYKEFRRLADRSTDVVNLTFTGRMLGSVTSTPQIGRRGVQIETSATGGQEQKAAFTDEMYEWLGLHPSERAQIKDMLEEMIDDIIDGRPDITIRGAG